MSWRSNKDSVLVPRKARCINSSLEVRYLGCPPLRSCVYQISTNAHSNLARVLRDIENGKRETLRKGRKEQQCRCPDYTSIDRRGNIGRQISRPLPPHGVIQLAPCLSFRPFAVMSICQSAMDSTATIFSQARTGHLTRIYHWRRHLYRNRQSPMQR